jgi:Right handed beta helix region
VCLLIPLTALSATIPISSLPFTITAPGTYVVTRNLTFSPPSGNTLATAITVSTALSGPVVIDLKGFTLTGSGSASLTVGVGIGFVANTSVPNAYPITIRNGTLLNFGFGVWAELDGSGIGITDLTVHNLTFTGQPADAGNGHAVTFRQVSSSTVNNCTFNSGNVGISDQESNGGNTYNNNIFNKCRGPLSIEVADDQALILSRCQLEAPPAN